MRGLHENLALPGLGEGRMDELLYSLNEAQREAVLATEGPVLVLAGAGSGKTRVLTHRVAYILREGLAGRGPGGSVLAVTFTNKAAREMRDRIERLIGAIDPAALQVGTFHSICARLLRRAATILDYPPGFTIYDSDDSLALISPLVGRNPVAGLTPRAAQVRISAAKNALVSPEGFAASARGIEETRLSEIYRAYQNALRRNGAFDFDDLLRCAVEALRMEPMLLARERARFRYVLVDEYQDTNHAQYRFAQLLAEEHRNLCVVGDDDQSIYAFRGADIRNILEFERDFPETRTVRLEQNYRSTRTILAAAHGVVSHNAGRKPKELWTENPVGELIELVLAADDREEAREIAKRLGNLPAGAGLGAVAVLYRTNAQSRALEDALRRSRVPHRIVGGIRFYERKEVKDAIAYLRALDNPRDDLSFKRALNTPRRGIGAVTLAALEERAAAAATSLQDGVRGLLDGSAVPVCSQQDGSEPAAAGDISQFVEGFWSSQNSVEPATMRLTGPALAGLESLTELLDRFRKRAAEEPVGAWLHDLLEESGLLEHVRDSGEPDAAERVDNLRELVASAVEFSGGAIEPDLPAFLQDVALLSEVDSAEFAPEAVTMLTLHNAKGLEFPVVFIAGVEEGLLPLTRGGELPADLEEERRLFYVGLTRARRQVVLTCARRRARHGWSEEVGGPSRFLAEIPQELLRVTERHGWREQPLGSTFAGPRRRGIPEGAHGRAGSRWLGGAGPLFASVRGSEDGFVPDAEPDYDASQDLAPRFVRGERVNHPRFGGGMIRRVSGFGRDVRVVVLFDEQGEKTLVARFARLEKET